MNYLLPFFNSKKSFLWDYLKKDKTITIYMEEKDIENDFLEFLSKKEEEFKVSVEKEAIVPSPEELYSNYSQIKENLKKFKSITCSYLNIDSQKNPIKFRQGKLPSLLISKDKKSPNIKPLLDFCTHTKRRQYSVFLLEALNLNWIEFISYFHRTILIANP